MVKLLHVNLIACLIKRQTANYSRNVMAYSPHKVWGRPELELTAQELKISRITKKTSILKLKRKCSFYKKNSSLNGI